MNESRVHYSIDTILAAARARLSRVAPEDLEREQLEGAVIVDIRPLEQRARDGALPGAIVIDRNVLEWRLDPSCDYHIPEISGHHTRIVIVCNEGYSSSLAASLLHDVGLSQATDLIGGYQAWLLARFEQQRLATTWRSLDSDRSPSDVGPDTTRTNEGRSVRSG